MCSEPLGRVEDKGIRQMDMFIAGEWTKAASGKRFDVVNPRDGSVVETVPLGDAADADLAVAAAAKAFEAWRLTPMAERVRLQHGLAVAMRDAAAAVGAVLHAELGRPLDECVSEVSRAADLLDVYAEEALRLRAETPLAEGPGKMTVVTRDPVGVVVSITPFNYPIMLLCLKIGAALVAGCTVVAKPSEDTPLSTLMLAEVFHRAGLPSGVLNVVTGARELGEALVAHPVPRKIAFTGGTAAGKAIAAAAAGTMKRLTLELGGHCPAIVCADADIPMAAQAVAKQGFRNAGQLCYRINRVFVERPVYEAFLKSLTEQAQALTLAPAGGTGDLGPLVNEKIYSTNATQTDDARQKGARILTGGARQDGAGFDGGFYFQPTIIADATDDMLIMQQETFGPVLGIAPVDSSDEALKRANDSLFGLGAYVFCRDLAKGKTLCDRLEAGTVSLNQIQTTSSYAPFGGMKESGIGREKGRYGVEAYLEYKTMYLSYDVPT